MSDQPKVHEAYEPDVTPGQMHGQAHSDEPVVPTGEPLGELFIDEDGHRRYVQPNEDGSPIHLVHNELQT